MEYQRIVKVFTTVVIGVMAFVVVYFLYLNTDDNVEENICEKTIQETMIEVFDNEVPIIKEKFYDFEDLFNNIIINLPRESVVTSSYPNYVYKLKTPLENLEGQSV